MKEMIDLIRNRRTVRKYRTEQIKEEELEKILEAGLCAPSAGNMQRVKIVALQNREISDHLGRINVSVMKRPASAHVSDEQPSIIDDPSIPSGTTLPRYASSLTAKKENTVFPIHSVLQKT